MKKNSFYLLVLLISIIFFTFLFKKVYKFILVTKNSSQELNDQITKKKMVRCNLFDEIIDRKIKDNERQCYYVCKENDTERVDTSIGYPCQPFIMELR